MSMSTTSLQRFPVSSGPSQPSRMSISQASGLESLAEGSQYALEKLHLSREPGVSTTTAGESVAAQSSADHADENNMNPGFRNPSQRDPLADARSSIRKTSTPVRRRISRACDQCNQLRTKCDGQNPCAHCIGTYHTLYYCYAVRR